MSGSGGTSTGRGGTAGGWAVTVPIVFVTWATGAGAADEEPAVELPCGVEPPSPVGTDDDGAAASP